MFVPIHKHILIKTTVNKIMTSEQEAKEMLKDLVKHIGMKAVTEPQAVYIEEVGNEGLTGSINLATSHIAFHLWDATKLLMIDVYSCCDFSTQHVIDFLDEKFHILLAHTLTVDRDTLSAFLPSDIKMEYETYFGRKHLE